MSYFPRKRRTRGSPTKPRPRPTNSTEPGSGISATSKASVPLVVPVPVAFAKTPVVGFQLPGRESDIVPEFATTLVPAISDRKVGFAKVTSRFDETVFRLFRLTMAPMSVKTPDTRTPLAVVAPDVIVPTMDQLVPPVPESRVCAGVPGEVVRPPVTKVKVPPLSKNEIPAVLCNTLITPAFPVAGVPTPDPRPIELKEFNGSNVKMIRPANDGIASSTKRAMLLNMFFIHPPKVQCDSTKPS
jgi:hypothetical protein